MPMRESERYLSLLKHTFTANPLRSWLLGVALTALVYLAAWTIIRQQPVALILLPVLLTGWCFGPRLGLLAGALAWPVNMLLALAFGARLAAPQYDFWLYLGVIAAGFIAGQWRADREANQQALARWQEKEAAWAGEQLAWQKRQAALINRLETAEADRDALRAGPPRQESGPAAPSHTALLASVGHELRSPLGAIIGFAEMLYAGYYGAVNRRQQQILRRLIRKAHGLTTQVNDLLDQAQLDMGKLTLNSTPIAPANLLAQIDDLHGLEAERKAVTLNTSLTPDLPPIIVGDPVRLQQIVTNLVDNAIKFTGEGGEVTVKMDRPEPGIWSIAVTDNGCGILPADQGTIFEAFRQGHRAQESDRPGFGLGLSIVKQLAEMMGGEVFLHSEPGQGSTFTVTLPLETAQPQLV